METRWLGAGQAESPMVSGSVAAQAIGGMEGPMAPIIGRRSAAWKGNGPSRRRPANEWNEMARPPCQPRRRGTAGTCHRQWDRNKMLQSSGVRVQRCGWFFPSPPIEQGRYDPRFVLLGERMARSQGGARRDGNEMTRRGARRVADGGRSGRGASDRRDGRPDGAGFGTALGGVEGKWPVAAPACMLMERNGSSAASLPAAWQEGRLPMPKGS